MATAAAIDDYVVTIYQEMKVRKGLGQDRIKLVLFCLSDDHKSIIVDKSSILYVKDVEGEPDIYKKVMSQLPDKQCRFGLYNCTYETKESQQDGLIFIVWLPEDAPVKQRMGLAASRNAIREKLLGIKFELDITEAAEIRDNSLLRNKFRQNVKSIEGKPV